MLWFVVDNVVFKSLFSEHFGLPYCHYELSDPYTLYLDIPPMVYNIISWESR